MYISNLFRFVSVENIYILYKYNYNDKYYNFSFVNSGRIFDLNIKTDLTYV